MNDRDETVHVHKLDMRMTVEQYKRKGYELKEERKSEISAQRGFRTLIFGPAKQPSVESSPFDSNIS